MKAKCDKNIILKCEFNNSYYLENKQGKHFQNHLQGKGSNLGK